MSRIKRCDCALQRMAVGGRHVRNGYHMLQGSVTLPSSFESPHDHTTERASEPYA